MFHIVFSSNCTTERGKMKLLKQYGYGKETNEIISSLKEYGIKPDFEAIFSVIEGLKNIKQGIKEAGPFTAYICKELSSIRGIPDSEKILTELKILIFEECSKINSTKLEKVFNPIFKENPNLQSHHWKNVATRIVTTNYDMAVEMYHWKRELPLSDGFQPTRNPHIHKYGSDIPVIKNSSEGQSYAKNQGKLLQ